MRTTRTIERSKQVRRARPEAGDVKVSSGRAAAEGFFRAIQAVLAVVVVDGAELKVDGVGILASRPTDVQCTAFTTWLFPEA